MSEDNALVPIEQKDVLFYEDEITAVRVIQEGVVQIFVPIRPIVELLGLDWSGQLRRTRNDPVLSNEIENVIVNTAGGPQEMPCLPLDMLNGWLFGINASRVTKQEVRDRLIRYQKDCYRVLYEAFEEGRLSTGADATFDELLQQSGSEAVEAYRMLQAMIKLARNQVIIEGHLDRQDVRLEDHEQRLEEIESTLGDPKRHVTPEQASQISQAVKAVAMELSKRTGRNEYGGVYGELYRRFEITSYKLLPANRFKEAMSFLTEWHQSLTGDAPF